MNNPNMRSKKASKGYIAKKMTFWQVARLKQYENFGRPKRFIEFPFLD